MVVDWVAEPFAAGAGAAAEIDDLVGRDVTVAPSACGPTCPAEVVEPGDSS